MKKLFTLLVLVSLVLTAGAQKKVIYLGGGRDDMATADGRDTLLYVLKHDAHFSVDSAVDYNDAPYAWPDLTSYDVVILSEYLDGKKCSTFVASVCTKPLLMMKIFSWTKERLCMGTPTDVGGGAMATHVQAGKETNAIFTGVTPIGDSIKIFNSQCSDIGSLTGTGKALQVITDGTYTATPADGVEVLAKATNAAGSVLGMNIFKLAPGTQVKTSTASTLYPDGQTYASTVYGFGFNGGCIWKRNNITKDGMRIIKNAVYILAGLDPALATSAPTTKVSSNLTVIPRTGNYFEVQLAKSQKVELAVYNMTGKLIERSQINGNSTIVDLSKQAKGIYIIKVAGMNRKVLVK